MPNKVIRHDLRFLQWRWSRGGALDLPLACAFFDARVSFQLAFILAIGVGIIGIILSLLLLQSPKKEMAVH